MFKSIQDVKAAVDRGSKVCWANDLYRVVKDHLGQYYIECTRNGNSVGLHEPTYSQPSELEKFFVLITYHRKPTASEVRFGHGATHYADFPLDDCRKPDGGIKQWIVCPHTGLRYYR